MIRFRRMSVLLLAFVIGLSTSALAQEQPEPHEP